MLRIGISCEQPACAPQAEQLAQTLQLPRLWQPPGQSAMGPMDYHLQVLPDGLQLQPAPHSALQHGPIRACLVGPDIQRRVRGGRKNPFARALGLYAKRPSVTLLDATAGLGRDAAVAAALGLQVTMLERHPLIHALLQASWQPLQQAQANAGLQLLPRMEAGSYLRAHPHRHDVVYLDPMFADRGKTALARKEMQTLRRVLHGAGAELMPEAELLTLARQACNARVVVKRHARAPHYAGVEPAHSISGKRVRYDVYLPT